MFAKRHICRVTLRDLIRKFAMEKKNRKKIGFDLDDVLLNFNDALFPYHNERFGTNYDRTQIRTFDLGSVWQCSRDEVEKRILDFCRSTEHHEAEPVSGALEVINRLKDHHDLFVITARPEELRAETLSWLNRHFPDVFAEVHFTNHFYGSGNRRAKGDVCREIAVESFIEDSLHNAADVASLGIPVLLFDAPWNQEEVAPPIKRIYSWEEVEEHIR